MLKGNEILYTKVVTFEQNPFSNTLKSVTILDKDTIIVTEQLTYSNNSLKIYYLYKEEKLNTAYIVKPFRAAHIRYPFYILIHGSKEVWVINLKDTDFIHRFYIGRSITCAETYNPLNGDQSEIRWGLCLQNDNNF
jgi:hypothetical protein